MRKAGSGLNEVLRHLADLSSVVGISDDELPTFVRVLSKASWAHVEFEPVDGVELELRAASGDEVELEVRVRRGNTMIIKEYTVPEFLTRRPIPIGCIRRARRGRRGRKRL